MEPMGIERHRRSPKGERAGVSESIEGQAKACTRVSKTYKDYSKRSRRESNPHLRFRKPLFCPLNYGNNDLERINGLNGVWQTPLRCDFSRGELCARLSAACLRVSLRGHFRVQSIWLPRLKKKLSWKSRICCSRTSSVTRSCRSISNDR